MRLNIVDLSIVTTRTTEYEGSCFGRLLRCWLSPDHDLRRCRYALMAYNAKGAVCKVRVFLLWPLCKDECC